MIFTIYTDGCCSGNRRGFLCPGGYAYVIIKEDGSSLCGGGGRDCDATNNKMELMAVISGLKRLSEILGDDSRNHDCIVKTDSKYVSDNYADYLQEWKAMGWRKANRKPVLNKSLWIDLDGMSPEFKSIKIHWVKGHAEDELNCKVDSMAKSNMANIPQVQP